MNFLIKNLTKFLFLFSIIIFFYVFIKSEIYSKGLLRNYYLDYYLLSISLFFFSLLTIFFSKKIKEYLIIIIISLFTSLYLFEIYLTFGDQIKNQKIYKKVSGNKWDVRTKNEIYDKLFKLDKNVSITIPLNFFLDSSSLILPLGGTSYSKTINCNENGYYSIFDSDRYGFNNPDKEWDSKNIEYLLLGDSFTLGDCVNRPKDIGSVLRNLSNKSVLNLGYVGSGPLMQYAALKEYSNSNIKKTIFIFYEGNDLRDLNKQKNNKILINYVNDLNFNQNLRMRQSEINKYLQKITDSELINLKKINNKFKKFFSIIKLWNIRFSIKEKNYSQPEPDNYLKTILSLTKEFTKYNNSNLYFVYLPEYARYSQKYENNSYNLVKKIVTDLKIELIDIHQEIFKKEKNPFDLFAIGHPHHYNEEGYKKVAEIIFNKTN